jgi:hypothetical protein
MSGRNLAAFFPKTKRGLIRGGNLACPSSFDVAVTVVVPRDRPRDVSVCLALTRPARVHPGSLHSLLGVAAALNAHWLFL